MNQTATKQTWIAASIRFWQLNGMEFHHSFFLKPESIAQIQTEFEIRSFIQALMESNIQSSLFIQISWLIFLFWHSLKQFQQSLTEIDLVQQTEKFNVHAAWAMNLNEQPAKSWMNAAGATNLRGINLEERDERIANNQIKHNCLHLLSWLGLV